MLILCGGKKVWRSARVSQGSKPSKKHKVYFWRAVIKEAELSAHTISNVLIFSLGGKCLGWQHRMPLCNALWFKITLAAWDLDTGEKNKLLLLLEEMGTLFPCSVKSRWDKHDGLNPTSIFAQTCLVLCPIAPCLSVTRLLCMQALWTPVWTFPSQYENRLSICNKTALKRQKAFNANRVHTKS